MGDMGERSNRVNATPSACIVATPGDRWTLCGNRSDTVGLTWGRHVQAHTDGHNPTWCPTCLTLWRTTTLRDWLGTESDDNRDRLDKARGALQSAGLPSPHVQGMLL